MDRFCKSSPSFQHPRPLSVSYDDDVEIGNGEGGVHVPQPLDCLQGTPVPPFLSKTYDLVDDPGLDLIISWSDTGASFVVWDPFEFARIILPRNFKHNNMSSFVRQLNTYGFRKVDTDRWEFACESFVRGKRHLLRNIQRRKSLQSQQGYEEANLLSIEAEIEKLHKDKFEMMQEVINLQQQQRGTHQYIESVNEKLQAAEDRQKQMVSSLAKVFQTPQFKKQGQISSSRKVRKFVTNQEHDPVDDTVRNLDIHSEVLPLQVHVDSDKNEDLVIKEESVFDLDFEAPTEYFLSSPVNLSDECLVKQEDIWRSEFETVAEMPGGSNEIWNDVGGYEYPDFGVRVDELSDIWNLEADNSPSGETNQYGF
ncbi:heat stress transcription factor A-3-like [Rutidosis leptorrhynchoides]|uniref:heat stress transcription factor A-3-like n=1 Tax=Rutidosis leptorrhynchoides TaxID=125765 RepID=UPI003A996F1A